MMFSIGRISRALIFGAAAVVALAAPVDAWATVIQPLYNQTPTTNDGTILNVGTLTYTVVSCNYSVAGTASVGSSSTVTGSTACPSTLGLQLVANGATGVSITGGANPFATASSAGAKGDVTLTILVQSANNLAIDGFTGSIVASTTGLQGSAGASIGITGVGSIDPSTTSTTTQQLNFTPVSSPTGVTLTIDASAAVGLSGTGTLTSFSIVGQVPEPASLSVLGFGLIGLAAFRRRRIA